MHQLCDFCSLSYIHFFKVDQRQDNPLYLDSKRASRQLLRLEAQAETDTPPEGEHKSEDGTQTTDSLYLLLFTQNGRLPLARAITMKNQIDIHGR